LRHVVGGQIVGTDHRDAVLPAPGVIEQQPGRRGGDIGGGAGDAVTSLEDEVIFEPGVYLFSRSFRLKECTLNGNGAVLRPMPGVRFDAWQGDTLPIEPAETQSSAKQRTSLHLA
jgi:hypothetical protein